MKKKTNAARILDRHKVTYELVEYDYDEGNLSATHLAARNGLPIASIYKTLVGRGDKTGIFVAVIPGAATLDLKAMAKASGNKKVALTAMKELLPLTGYIRGGCSPLGMKKVYPTFLDATITEHQRIYISAGVRGLKLLLSPTDLQRVTQA
ncbi:MAG: Cys-tRNA(Pro) deacylase, partial [Bacteroidota bacterium]